MQRLFILMAFVASFSIFSLSLNAQDLQLDSTLLTATDVATGLIIPWEVTYGPDDHLWVTERRGNVLRINPENGNTVTILNYQSQVEGGNSEYGMLGMALHPDFMNTPLVYIVYCYAQGGIRERLSSFEWNGTELTSENILFDEIQGGGIHDGSRLLITTDNKILMTTGDRGNGSLSQNMNSLNGKILRLNLDGTIPADNPDPASYIYSFGHRNPQGLAYGPDGQIYSSEHGAQQSDEFNLIGASTNYGWPSVEGACNTPSEQSFCAANNVREPLIEFSPCAAINDITYYNHPAIPEWEGKMLMAVLGGFALNDSRLSVMTFADGGSTVMAEDRYLDNLGRLRDVAVNPHTGSVYVATNGPFYPGSGPNRIIEYRNDAYEPNNVSTPNTGNQFIKLFPNPVAGQLQLQLSPNFVGQQLEIISFNGQVVSLELINNAEMRLDASNWPAGMYFIRATNETGTITRTFSKV